MVPLSGGGLIGGIAVALKARDPAIRVIGASASRAAVMYESLQVGRPIACPEEATIADALAGGIGLDNQHTFRLVQEHVDEHIVVAEDEIREAMAFAAKDLKLVVEGGGAVALATILAGKLHRPGSHVAVVVSGGNVELSRLLEVVGGARETG